MLDDIYGVTYKKKMKTKKTAHKQNVRERRHGAAVVLAVTKMETVFTKNLFIFLAIFFSCLLSVRLIQFYIIILINCLYKAFCSCPVVCMQ